MNTRRFLVLLAALLLATMLWAAPGASGESWRNTRPAHFYVSLGDSLAAGTQPGRPVSDEGYADQLYAELREEDSKLRHVKLGCPGERAATMIFGGLPHCRYAHGTQLAEAVAFLRAHGKAVHAVTIDIGANDLLACAPAFVPTCISAALASVQTNLPAILSALHGAGPTVPIVGMNYYNPFLALWFSSPPAALATTQLVVTQVNPLLEALYGAAGTPVADVEAAFSTTNFTPQGGIPFNVLRVCQWTWMCTPAQDIHPNAVGYGVIAAAFEAVLGEEDEEEDDEWR